uniref:FAD-dependent oxidoreductase n=1 Tax=Nosocomiicoccus massiliensis TaxID=1232430 RepID=UPI0005925D20
TIIEGSQNIIPNEDKDVIRTLKKHLEHSNVKIITDFKISNETVTVNDGVSIEYNDETLNFEQVIVAIGRKANIDDIGLNNTKAKFTTYIETNEFFQTEDSHIYAIGDVLNTYQLAHVASKEGMIAVEHIKCLNPIPLNYDTVPRCIYTNLEVGVVGPSEDQLKEKGIEYKVSVLPLQAVGKAIIENDGEGFVKLIADKDNMLIGASIVGPNATEIINELSLASFLNSSIEELYNAVHAHPSISEGIMESALLIDERGIHF